MRVKSIFLGCLLMAGTLSVFADEISGLRFIVEHNPLTAPSSSPFAHSSSLEFLNTETNELNILFHLLLKFYQIVLSSQDRPACMFTPSCSEYARLALQKYGLIPGMIMAADRLLRCNGTGKRYYRTDKQTGRLADPLE